VSWSRRVPALAATHGSSPAPFAAWPPLARVGAKRRPAPTFTPAAEKLPAWVERMLGSGVAVRATSPTDGVGLAAAKHQRHAEQARHVTLVAGEIFVFGLIVVSHPARLGAGVEGAKEGGSVACPYATLVALANHS